MTTIGTVYESMMRNQRTYLANQDDKHRLEDEWAKPQNTRPLISISLNKNSYYLYLVLQSAPTHVNGVDGYSEVAPTNVLISA